MVKWALSEYHECYWNQEQGCRIKNSLAIAGGSYNLYWY